MSCADDDDSDDDAPGEGGRTLTFLCTRCLYHSWEGLGHLL
jgi:hypothetical protein